MRYFTTSDTHFGHGRIIEYSNRPFKSAFEMNEKLIANWNMRVKPEDTVFFLGDFCFRTDNETSEQLGGAGKEKADFWIKRLNGNIIFVKGNHDRNNSLKTCIESINITYANQRIHLCHKPEHADPKLPINLVGHVHGKWRIRTFQEHYQNIATANSILGSDRQDWEKFLLDNTAMSYSQSILLNVGVDVQRYQPITLDEAVGQCMKFKHTGVKE